MPSDDLDQTALDPDVDVAVDVTSTSRTSAKATDGRRNNKTPEASRIKPKEIRNPHGRRGKPKPVPTNLYEDFFVGELLRVVTHDTEGPVSSLHRMMQAEIHGALMKDDEKIRRRVLDEAATVFARRAAKHREAFEWFLDFKIELEKKFRAAQKAKLPPPDFMHPDHLVVSSGGVLYVGPMDPGAREAWERLKSAIKVAAVWHELAREKAKADPSPANIAELNAVAAHRRMLMRRVPKGWNWREEIYCRHSRTEFTNEVLRAMREVFDEEA